MSKATLVVAGLPVTVYSEQPYLDVSGPVAILFFLHGRNGSAKAIEWIAQDTIKQVAEKRKGDADATDLLVVTFVSVAYRRLVDHCTRPVHLGSAQPR